MKVMSVDPHKSHIDWIVFIGDTIAGYGSHPINDMVKIIRTHRPNIILIEEQFVGFNRKGALELSKVAGEVAGIGLACGADIVWVNPRTWKSKMGFLKDKRRGIITAAERIMREEVRKTEGLSTPHLQDSFFIYKYWYNNGGKEYEQRNKVTKD